VPLQAYELRFESDDKCTLASTMLDGTFEQVQAKVNDIVRRRAENGMFGKHTLLCPDGREIRIDQLKLNQSA